MNNVLIAFLRDWLESFAQTAVDDACKMSGSFISRLDGADLDYHEGILKIDLPVKGALNRVKMTFSGYDPEISSLDLTTLTVRQLVHLAELALIHQFGGSPDVFDDLYIVGQLKNWLTRECVDRLTAVQAELESAIFPAIEGTIRFDGIDAFTFSPFVVWNGERLVANKPISSINQDLPLSDLLIIRIIAECLTVGTFRDLQAAKLLESVNLDGPSRNHGKPVITWFCWFLDTAELDKI